MRSVEAGQRGHSPALQGPVPADEGGGVRPPQVGRRPRRLLPLPPSHRLRPRLLLPGRTFLCLRSDPRCVPPHSFLRISQNPSAAAAGAHPIPVSVDSHTSRAASSGGGAAAAALRPIPCPLRRPLHLLPAPPASPAKPRHETPTHPLRFQLSRDPNTQQFPPKLIRRRRWRGVFSLTSFLRLELGKFQASSTSALRILRSAPRKPGLPRRQVIIFEAI